MPKYEVVRTNPSYYHHKTHVESLEDMLKQRILKSSSQDSLKIMQDNIDSIGKAVAVLGAKFAPEEMFELFGDYDESLREVE